jgi:cell division protein FtsN
MSDPKDDAARPNKVEPELDALLAKLSGPLTPAGKSGRTAPGGQTVASPDNRGSAGRQSGPRESAESLSRQVEGDPDQPPIGPSRDDSLPADVEAFSRSYHAALFPTSSGTGQSESAIKADPATAARTLLPTLLIGGLLVMVIALGAGIFSYRSAVDAQITRKHRDMDVLQQELATRDRDILALQDTIRGLREDQKTAGQSIQRLAANIDAMQRDTADQILDLSGKLEQLEQRAAQAETAPHAAGSVDAKPSVSMQKLTPDQPDAADTAANRPKPAAGSSQAVSHAGQVSTSGVPDPDQAPGQTWVVNLASHGSRPDALAQAQRLLESGVSAVVGEVTVKGKKWYRVRVEGFPNAKEAEAFRTRYRSQAAFSDAWVAQDR